MYAVSIVEKQILDSMVKLSKNNIVKATFKEICINAGKKSTGGIYTHAIHNLESMGVIRKITKNTWVILKREPELNEKGSRILFYGANNEVLEEVKRGLEKIKNVSEQKEVLDIIEPLLNTVSTKLDITS